ncbi:MULTISPECIES: sugar MFS transporter [unclassified Saccharopolyspora]|uniref:MFS transporter n=1 Tax=unclassified Saccharopolyspora TaxID=2646250 RepID=UPI001CD28D22|nr:MULTISPECIES: MFS transporter [unclassified Saccharopolyspora]MCA1184936.1 MFS transporter [Saccharopolyspora sp. 6T]MCA1190657.1 MFS transporter [Saccharopolyspora sp. 6V]MCA1279898.1 MFS transporter [Saccharopolyspora sp. 7B]
MVETTSLFRRGAVVGCLFAMTAIGALTAAHGPAIPAFRAEQGIDGATAAGGLAAQSIGAVAGILLSQALLRRRGNTAAVGASALLVAVGSVAIALAPSWPLILASAAVAGLGLGGCDVLITQLLIVGAGSRGPALVNVAHACFGLGTALAPAAIAAIGAEHYRVVFAGIGSLALVGLATVRGISAAPTPLELTARTAGDAAPRRLAGTAIVLGFLVLYVTHFGVQSGIGSWEPTVLAEQGYGAAAASLATSGFWLAMVGGRFAAASLSRRVPLPALVVASCAGMVAAAAVALHGPATAWAYLLAGFCIGPIFPNGLTWLAASGHAHGGRFAAVIAASMIGMALAPTGLGAVIGRWGTQAVAPSVLAIAALALLAGGFVTVLTRAGARPEDGGSAGGRGGAVPRSTTSA